MAFSLKQNKGPMAEINVTPMVDVMLVLLVIFMITAPMLFNGVPLKLPRTQRVDTVSLTNEQVILSMTKEGEYFIGDKKLILDEIVPSLKGLMETKKVEVVYLRADYSLPYGDVARLMTHLKKGDITNIAIVTEVEPQKPQDKGTTPPK